MQMQLEDVLIEPVVSEKATMLREQNKYVFIVRPDANKYQISAAVAKLFNVNVVKCTTMNVKGKPKRTRGIPGKTSAYKKAIVRLAPGQTIQAFEGV